MPLLISLFVAALVSNALELRVAGPAGSAAIVRIVPFEKGKHTLTAKPIIDQGAPMTYVDGKFAWGCGGGPPIEVPQTGIRSIVVRFGKKRVAIPRKLFDDLFNVGKGDFELTKGSKPGVMKLHLNGSDGYAGYGAQWTIWKDGRCTRIVNPGP